MEVTRQRRVRFGDLALEVDEIRAEIDEAVDRVLTRGWFVLGAEGESFESEFATWLGAEHAVGCGNGTDAITLALQALGIGAGDEVITVVNTCVPTAAGIRGAGCTLRLVDCDPRTLQIESAMVEAAITSRTRAVVAVHLYGNSPDMQALTEVCGRAGVALVEDCAQAHGTKFDGRSAGTWGVISAWSFYPSKNLGAYGDGGAVVTHDADLADRVRRLRNYGQRVRYYHDEEGRNSRLDEIQAAVLRVKLRHLGRWNEQRRHLAGRYEELLPLAVTVPLVHAGSVSSRHLFPVLVSASRRDALREELSREGIETQIHYPVPLHRQKAYMDMFVGASYRHGEDAAARLITLPLFPQLPEESVEFVAATLRRLTE